MNHELTLLSKTISHALRHEPETYNLNLDSEGWVKLEDLITALRRKGIDADYEKINFILDNSEKKRFQVLNDRIRAYYGHSIEKKIIKQPHQPPEYLYHGTQAENIESIKKEGLLPMDRQYVHLSTDVDTATRVAIRRRGETAILKINALDASNNGVNFYKEENNIWLSDPIPPEFITFERV